MKKIFVMATLLTTIGLAAGCKKSCIDTSQAGTRICTDEYLPVCGCDGKTYSNGCYATRAGVTSYEEGACE